METEKKVEEKKTLTPESLVEAIKDAVKSAGTENRAEVTKAVTEALVGVGLSPYDAKRVANPGDQFASDPSVKEFAQIVVAKAGKGKLGGTPPIEVDLPRYGLKSGEYSPAFLRKDLVDTSMFPSQRTYLPLADFPRRTLRLRDVFPVAGLGTPRIEYARMVGYTHGAAGVIEQGREGAADKPQAALETELVVDSVKQIAAWIPVTRQALRDVTGLGAYINNVLAYFIQIEEDDQILNGAGGADLNGILNTTGVLTQPRGSDTVLDAFRKGITRLAVSFGDAGFDAEAAVFNPYDWETVELQKDLNGQYLLIPSQSTVINGVATPPALWRVPVVVTPAMPQGTALIGAFSIGATLWTYDPLTLRATDSHADYFVKNLMAILAELRELLAVYFPGAFVKITGLGGEE